MAAKGGLFSPITGDSDDLARELQRAQDSLRKLGTTAQGESAKAAGALGRLKGAAGGMKDKLLGPLKGLGPALGAASVVAFGKQSVAAFQDAEKASNALEQSFAKYPKLGDSSAGAITKIAGAIAGKTAAEDDSIVSGAAALSQFGLTGKQVEDTLPLLVDYARRTGKDIPGAAKVLGKAFLGKTAGLKAVGVNLKSTGDAQKDYANVTEALRAQVGGFAEGEMSTTSAKLENLKNRFGNVQEIVGGKLVGAFDFLARNMAVIGPILAVITGAFLAYKIATAAAALINLVFGSSLTIAAGPVLLIGAAIALVVVAFIKWRDEIMGAIKFVAGFFVAAFGKIRDFLAGVWRAIFGGARAVWNGITAYFRTVLAIYKAIFLGAWNAIKAVVLGAWHAIRDTAKAVWNGIVAFFRGALSAFANFFSTRWHNLVTNFGRIFSGIGALAKAPLNAVIALVNKAIGGVNLLIKGFNRIPAVPNIPLIPEIPKLDLGGTVLSTGLAIVHRGETYSGVGPARRPLGAGGNVYVTLSVAGSVLSEDDLVDTVRRGIARAARRDGRTGFENAGARY
jgi:hypothetical protein